MNFESRINYLCIIPKIAFIGFLVLVNILLYWLFIYAVFFTDVSIGIGAWIAIMAIWLILSWMTFYMIRSLFTGTLKIGIKSTGLEIYRPLMGNKEMYPWNEIIEFYTSYEYNKQRSLAQLIIYIEGKKKLKISEESVINYNEMVEAFKCSPVKYAGFKEQGLIDFE
jgi:hypothetical protein